MASVVIKNGYQKDTFHFEDRLELSFNSNEFGRVLLIKPSMFGKLEVHASEECGGLNQ